MFPEIPVSVAGNSESEFKEGRRVRDTPDVTRHWITDTTVFIMYQHVLLVAYKIRLTHIFRCWTQSQ